MENIDDTKPIKTPAKTAETKKPKTAPAKSGADKTVPKPSITPNVAASKPSVTPNLGAKKPTIAKPTSVAKKPDVNTSSGPAKPSGTPKELANANRPNIKAVDATGVGLKQDDTENKKKKKKWLLLLLLLLLICAGVGTAIYFITKIPKTDIRFEVKITDYNFATTTEDSLGQQIDAKYVPGDNNIKAHLTFKINNNKGAITQNEKVYVRFRIRIYTNGDEENMYSGFFEPNFEKEEEWTKFSDGYYYYNYFCYGNETLTPFKSVDFVGTKDNNVLNGKTGTVVFEVEILEGNPSAISAMWKTAPQNWNPVKKEV